MERTFQCRRTIGGRELLRPSECGGRIGAQPDASESAQSIFTRGTSGDKCEAGGGNRGIFARKTVEEDVVNRGLFTRRHQFAREREGAVGVATMQRFE